MPRFVRTLLLLGVSLLFGFSPMLLRAQEKKNSPVFRSYRPPPVAPRVQESDALRQIWYAFLAARKANAGDRQAQQELGVRHMLGRGVERDTAKAAYWMMKAATQGMVTAKFNVAIMSFHGWGMPWDPFLSYRYLLEAAAEEMPEAEYFVAVTLTDNLVVPRDWKQAHSWMKKAADAGYQPAKDALPEFAEKSAEAEESRTASPWEAGSSPLLSSTMMPVLLDFPGDSTRPDQKSLIELVKGAGAELRMALGLSARLDSTLSVDSVTFGHLVRAADAGSPEALTVLGRCAESGLDMEKDSVAAAAFFVRAVRLDGPRAPALLLQLLQQRGFQVQMKARSSRGDPVAEFVWAGLAALGFDNMLAPPQALQMLRRSMDRDFVPAIIEMGLWYYGGKFIDQDRGEAASLWRRAARNGSRDAEVRLVVTALREGGGSSADSSAITLLQTAVSEGSLLAQVGLGYCSEHGIGVRKSPADAAHWYRNGAVRGSQDAYRALRRLYDARRPSEKEFEIEEE